MKSLYSSNEVKRDTSKLENDDRVYLKPFLNKRYAVVVCDGKMEALLRNLGLGAVRRAMFRSFMQKMELNEENGVYTLNIYYAFREMKQQFRIGVEFDDETPIKQKMRTTFYQQRSTLTQVSRGEKTFTIVREFQLQPEQVKVTVTLDDIVANRIYKPFARHF